MSVYDFRHTRISIGANSGAPLAGLAYLVGHKHVSTTSIYVQTGEQAAAKALDVMASAPPGKGHPLGNAVGDAGRKRGGAKEGT